MNTPITYYGGKQTLANDIIRIMPAHKVYCEPFFGGGAVFFRKGKSYLECINDINHKLINFYQICQTRFDELEKLVKTTLHSEAMFMHSKDIYFGTTDASDIEMAWAVWLLTNNSFGGKIGGGWKFCNGTAGSHSGVSLRHKRDCFTRKVAERLQDVQISCRDALTVIADRDTKQTVFYIDPPYPGSDQGHYKGYGFAEFRELLSLLSIIKGKFILSNFPSDVLQEYIDSCGWNVISMDMALTIANKMYAKRKTELLVFNFKLEGKLF